MLQGMEPVPTATGNESIPLSVAEETTTTKKVVYLLDV